MWNPLGGTWRQRGNAVDDFGVPVRKNADDGSAYVHGCVPQWNRKTVRKLSALAHELTWCYYRMRRHALHPERKEVGDPAMPPEAVIEKMRSGTANQFQFWRDLKPPFYVSAIRRDPTEPGTNPDGDLFHVTYQCGIDYVGERLWNEKSEGGTFDNMIHGVAQIRIPDGYPAQRQIYIMSWGKPSLNWVQEEPADGLPPEGSFVNPDIWMPISDELSLSPNMARFAACRDATRKAHRRRPVEVAPLQALLLGPHASLPRLAANADVRDSAMGSSPTNRAGTSAEGATPSPQKKKRQHRIYTAAAGFVRYAG